MDLIKALKWRYATKKMNGTPVPQAQVDRVLEAISLAPSSMGLQPYTVLVVTNPGVKQKIFEEAAKQSQVVDCSHLLVFAAWDNVVPSQVEEYIGFMATARGVSLESLNQYKGMILSLIDRPKEENFNWAARQTYIAFGTAIAAAAEAQVDATPMEGFDGGKLDSILGLKGKGLRSVTLLPLGYRDAENDWLANLPKVRRAKDKLFNLID
ncbi:nitroreductase family protein [Cytophagaceae bacterium ABcell3]|nr:nitroreductase family protein [Cytophagaceae bacterium ABcell3]